MTKAKTTKVTKTATKSRKPAIQTEIDRKPSTRKLAKAIANVFPAQMPVSARLATPSFEQVREAAKEAPQVVVSQEIADAFGMQGLPNTTVIPTIIPTPLSAPQNVPDGGFKIDVTRGTRNSVLHHQWANRPDDQRFTSMSALRTYVDYHFVNREEPIINVDDLAIEAPEGNGLVVRVGDNLTYPSNWAFSQLAEMIAVPHKFLTKLSPRLATECIREVRKSIGEDVKVLISKDTTGKRELRAITSPTYGRIYNSDVLDQIERLTKHSDIAWKIPGEIDWSTMRHNPAVDVTKDNTTLYASDRDMFVFLCDDSNPIEAGKLPNGEPDLYFKGFYAYNSETGNKGAGIATFMLRGVCMNRNLWGVEGFKEVKLKHYKNALANFITKASPVLQNFAQASTSGFSKLLDAARGRKIATTDEERREFLVKRCEFNQRDTGLILGRVREEEGHPMETLYDAIQGITAFARSVPYQDKRILIEARATEMLENAA